MRRLLVSIVSVSLLLVVLPIRVHADEKRVHPWAMRALDIALSVDLAVTCYGLGAGQIDEINPALRWASNRPILFGLVKGAGNVGVRELVKRSKSTRFAIVLTAATASVIAWNVSRIQHR